MFEDAHYALVSRIYRLKDESFQLVIRSEENFTEPNSVPENDERRAKS